MKSTSKPSPRSTRIIKAMSLPEFPETTVSAPAARILAMQGAKSLTAPVGKKSSPTNWMSGRAAAICDLPWAVH